MAARETFWRWHAYLGERYALNLSLQAQAPSGTVLRCAERANASASLICSLNACSLINDRVCTGRSKRWDDFQHVQCETS